MVSERNRAGVPTSKTERRGGSRDVLLHSPLSVLMSASSTDGDASSQSGTEGATSLYDPPFDDGEAMTAAEGEDHETLRIKIPRDMARRLLRVSMHLGLSPSLVASRAIDLVWDEIGTVSDGSLSTQTLIQRYQARVDILQILESGLDEEGGGHGTKSASSQSPRSSDADEDKRFQGSQLWDAEDEINDVRTVEDAGEGDSSADSAPEKEEKDGREPVSADGDLSGAELRRPEQEEHSWEEVDEIIETGEETKEEA